MVSRIIFHLDGSASYVVLSAAVMFVVIRGICRMRLFSFVIRILIPILIFGLIDILLCDISHQSDCHNSTNVDTKITYNALDYPNYVYCINSYVYFSLIVNVRQSYRPMVGISK